MDLGKSTSFSKRGIVYILVILVAVSITSAIHYYVAARQLENRFAKSGIDLLSQVNENVNIILKSVDNSALTLMQDTLTDDFMFQNYESDAERLLMATALQQKISNTLSSNHYIDSLYIYTSIDAKIITRDFYSNVQDFYDVGWLSGFKDVRGFFAYLNTREVIFHKSQLANPKDYITLIRPYPVTNKKSEIRGALVLNIDESVLYKIISANKSDRLSQILITNNQGRILSNGNKQELYSDYKNKEYMQRILDSDSDGYFFAPVDDINSIIFYSSASYNNWKYIGITPVSTITKSFSDFRNLFILLSVVMCAIGITCMLMINNWTFKPFNALVTTITSNVGTTHLSHTKIQDFHDIERLFGEILKSNESMRLSINDHTPIIRWRLIMDLLMGHCVDSTQTIRKLEHLNVPMHFGAFMVFVIEPRSQIDAGAQKIRKVAEEMINTEQKGVAIDLYDGKVAVIISFEEQDEHESITHSVAEMIKNYLAKAMGISVSIGVGSVAKCLEHISLSYFDALEALKFKVIIGEDSIISIEDLNSATDFEFHKTAAFTKQISIHLRDNDKNKTLECLDTIFKHAVENKFKPEMVRELSIQLIMECIRILEESGLDPTTLVNDDTADIYQTLNRFGSVDEVKKCLKEFLAKFTLLRGDKKDQKSENASNSRLIRKIQQYIRENYMQGDLSLNFLADKFNISMPYLSRLFKELTGMKFIDYLISIRIEAAIELLRTSDLRINEISDKVGYSNFPSFIRIFKRHTGKTPSEFRKDTDY